MWDSALDPFGDSSGMDGSHSLSESIGNHMVSVENSVDDSGNSRSSARREHHNRSHHRNGVAEMTHAWNPAELVNGGAA